MLNELGHLQYKFLVEVLVVDTLFQQFEIKLSCLVINAELTHLGYASLFSHALNTLQL